VAIRKHEETQCPNRPGATPLSQPTTRKNQRRSERINEKSSRPKGRPRKRKKNDSDDDDDDDVDSEIDDKEKNDKQENVSEEEEEEVLETSEPKPQNSNAVVLYNFDIAYKDPMLNILKSHQKIENLDELQRIRQLETNLKVILQSETAKLEKNYSQQYATVETSRLNTDLYMKSTEQQLNSMLKEMGFLKVSFPANQHSNNNNQYQTAPPYYHYQQQQNYAQPPQTPVIIPHF
jgi:hypothetical protein